ncbi:TPA: peptidoglycan editing factor PgeF [Candidatus Berkelbacteria bacterium]|uniref:Purine nucleoside phosphorylase n=1 Tax=Berkelbacteria bacterium GW2011_GWE1_39_12 TaxID=1618337 RepID=A0A0G4B4K2_9BACT|nr:MAG: hypothetical protein UT28_C0001G0117 [Berkelbacteria bacterium GW2011_GWE1_39_12]HBO60504.1 peptidoglycan editing factor PgeF [Candidatus Berkelbacteria bacterium]
MEERFYKFSSFSCFPEIVQGISNRSYGEMKFGSAQDAEVIKNRKQFAKDLGIELNQVIFPHQVHGNRITAVGKAEGGKGALETSGSLIEADGLITAEKGIYLGITTADCLPILIYDPANRVVAAIHAGWRGIIDQIVPRAIEKFKEFGSDPENLIVGVGPGICQKHFVVKNEVLKIFLDRYPSVTFVRNKDGYVDLKKALFDDLKKAGVSKDNIEIADFCTVCDNGIYGSFRKEGEKGPKMIAVIGLK